MKVFIYGNVIHEEKNFEWLNKWLVSKGRQPVENPIFQDVPEDVDIKDFVNGYFSQSNYDERKQVEREERYERLVEQYIRQKYSFSKELARLRQRDAKPEEFEEYNAYAEECKERAKGEINK